MENLFFILALLSLLAFIIGMIKPKFVVPFKQKQNRGMVALMYIGLFIIFASVGSQLSPTSESSLASNNIDTDNNTLETDNQSKEIEEVSSIGKEIQIGHFVYTINKVNFKKTVGDEFVEETADGIYLLIEVSIKNISEETRTLDGSFFYVTDKDNMKYEYSTNGSTTLEMSGIKTVFLKECQPRITSKGTLIFEVPERGEYYLHLVGSMWGANSVRVLLK